MIYTTNALESVNARVRKIIKTRGHFPNDEAASAAAAHHAHRRLVCKDALHIKILTLPGPQMGLATLRIGP